MFPFITFSFYSIFPVITAISTMRFVRKPVFILWLIILLFGVLKLTIALATHGIRFSDLAELKIIIIIIILGLRAKDLKNYQAKVLLLSFNIFCFVCLVYAILYLGRITRFMDFIPFFTHYLSIYLAVTAACFSAVYIRKNFSMIWVFITASGTGLLALFPVLMYKLYQLRKKKIIFLIFLIFTFAMIIFILQVQFSRGRDINDLESIDRFIFYAASYEYIYQMSHWKIFFGHGLGEHIGIDKFMPIAFSEYVLNERDGYIPPRMFHSDLLRVFFQFGLIGVIFIFWSFSLVIKNKLLLFVLIFAGLANSIIYITPIMVVVYYLNRVRNEKEN